MTSLEINLDLKPKKNMIIDIFRELHHVLYMYGKCIGCIGKYSSPMDPMGCVGSNFVWELVGSLHMGTVAK